MRWERLWVLGIRPRVWAITKPALGIAILALVLARLDTGQLASVAGDLKLTYLFLGAFAMTLFVMLSALRWQIIARCSELQMSFAQTLRITYQSFAINSVMPGAIIGGDAWRAISLFNHASTADCSDPSDLELKRKRRKRALFTVIQDRVSGVWAMGVISLCGGLFALDSISQSVALSSVWLGYLAFCGLLALTPPLAIAAIRRIRAGRDRIHALQNRFWRASWASLAAQGMVMLAWWSSLNAVLDFSLAASLATGAAIFLAGVIPLSIAGFGPREAGAITMLVPLGTSPEQAVTASLIFGILSLSQGILGSFVMLQFKRDLKEHL